MAFILATAKCLSAQRLEDLEDCGSLRHCLHTARVYVGVYLSSFFASSKKEHVRLSLSLVFLATDVTVSLPCDASEYCGFVLCCVACPDLWDGVSDHNVLLVLPSAIRVAL